jgi:N-acyl amino acid synthase of PEP-CTERM/exosortase system
VRARLRGRASRGVVSDGQWVGAAADMDTIERSSAGRDLTAAAAVVLDLPDPRDQKPAVAPSSTMPLVHMARSEVGPASSHDQHDARSLPTPGAFCTRRIDDDPQLLTDSYRLRYQVYCVEREFLDADNYPDQLEVDEFDRYAWHFGTLDSTGRLVATARLVAPSILGLPLFRRCSIFPEEVELYTPHQRIVEVSRLSMSRTALNAGIFAGLSGSRVRPIRSKAARNSVSYSLYRGLYQESKRAGLSHWAVATEASLQRAVGGYGFPFRAIGPAIDYFGPVTPYLMDLSMFDCVILNGKLPQLNGFLDGLEDRYRPRDERAPT